MRNKRILSILSALLVLALALSACAPVAAPAGSDGDAAASGDAASDEVIELEYWQYNFEARITAMDQLIEMFEEEHPNIRILHNADFPYDDFRDKIATSVPAGVGPDVVTLFYGWQLDWIAADYIVPLPEEEFPAL